MLRYGSICSGIEAASVAFGPLGWAPVFFAEVEPFCCAVLQHHYPTVPNVGDFTQIGKEVGVGAIDLVIGGTPCQSFSVAGRRAGLADPRGNLTLEYFALVDRLRPRWLVWENVPGLLSDNGGRTFGTCLGLLAECGYGFAYRLLDAQYAGVPQRRLRLFLVGYLGDWRPPAAVLFEWHSLQGHLAPRRETGESPTGSLSARTTAGGGLGTDFDCQGGVIAFDTTQITHPANHSQPQVGDACHPLTSEGHAPSIAFRTNQTGAQGPIHSVEVTDTLAQDHAPAVCFSTSGQGYWREGVGALPQRLDKDSENGVVLAVRTAQTSANGHGVAENVSHTLDGAQGQAIAFEPRYYSDRPRMGGMPSDVTSPLKSSDDRGGDAAPHVLAFIERPRAHGRNVETQDDLAYCLTNPGSGGRPHSKLIQDTGLMVRRLTPLECELLQGLPREYTNVPYRGKPAKDAPRYRSIGNSFAVPCVRWIGERIQRVETLLGALSPVAPTATKEEP